PKRAQDQSRLRRCEETARGCSEKAITTPSALPVTQHTGGGPMRTFIAVGSFLIFCTLAAYGIDDRKLVDMTYPFSHETLHWPTAKGFELETVNERRTPQGYWYSSYNYSASEHVRSEEHTSELQSRGHLVCRLLLEKKK